MNADSASEEAPSRAFALAAWRRRRYQTSGAANRSTIFELDDELVVRPLLTPRAGHGPAVAFTCGWASGREPVVMNALLRGHTYALVQKLWREICRRSPAIVCSSGCRLTH